VFLKTFKYCAEEFLTPNI